MYEPAEQFDVLAEGIGITNAAARTTPGSGDLRRNDFAGAAERLARIDTRWIGFVGKEAYRGTFGERPELGAQERTLGDTKLFVLAFDVARERRRAVGGAPAVVLSAGRSGRLSRPAEAVPVAQHPVVVRVAIPAGRRRRRGGRD